MTPDLRSSTTTSDTSAFTQKVSQDEAVLGDKAVGGKDDDADHVANVASGLKS